MTRRKRRVGAVAAGTLAAWMGVGCGGGSGGSNNKPPGTTFTTAVSGSKTLNTLTESERAQICGDLSAYVGSPAVRMSECSFSGNVAAEVLAMLDPASTDADLQAACTDAYNRCLDPDAGAGAAAGSDTSAMCATDSKTATSCTITVNELAACVSTIPDILGGSLAACNLVTRASLTRDGGVSSPLSATSSAACANVDAKCPGFLGGPSASAEVLTRKSARR